MTRFEPDRLKDALDRALAARGESPSLPDDFESRLLVRVNAGLRAQEAARTMRWRPALLWTSAAFAAVVLVVSLVSPPPVPDREVQRGGEAAPVPVKAQNGVSPQAPQVGVRARSHPASLTTAAALRKTQGGRALQPRRVLDPFFHAPLQPAERALQRLAQKIEEAPPSLPAADVKSSETVKPIEIAPVKWEPLGDLAPERGGGSNE